MLVLAVLVVIIDSTILALALKVIQEDLHASQSELAWAIDAYTLVFAALLFTYGVLGDRWGRKKALLFGLCLFGVGSVLAAMAPSPAWLIGWRALMAVGGAAVLPSTLSIISNVFEPLERAKAIGIWAGATGLAVVIGPLAGGVLLNHFWWGSVFLVNVPIVVLAVAGIAWLVPESKDPDPGHLDLTGVVLSFVGLFGLVYGLIEGGAKNDWGSPAILGPLVGGLAVLALWVVLEARSARPSLDVSLFRSPAFAAASVVITLATFTAVGSTFFISFYLQLTRGLDPLHAGLSFLPAAAAILFFSPRSVALVRRYGGRVVVSAGLLLVAVSMGILALVDEHTPIVVVLFAFLLQGIGMAHVTAPATESMMSVLPREKSGAGSAVTSTLRQVGGALGVAIMGSVLSTTYRSGIHEHTVALPPDGRDQASESIGSTLVAAAQLPGTARDQLTRDAFDAFHSAMQVSAAASAAVVLLTAFVAARFLPGRVVSTAASVPLSTSTESDATPAAH
jgi:EmrB/QacA subfamily drug resistance transporter